MEIWVPRLRNLDFDCNFDRVYNNYYNYTSFDVEFDEDFEFLFKILIPPTYFEIPPIFKFCVGGLKKILPHEITNFILS